MPSDAASTWDKTKNMVLEAEPKQSFRGRTQGDFIHQKSTKREKEPREPGSPRYIHDRNDHPYLSLLVRFCTDGLSRNFWSSRSDSEQLSDSWYRLQST
jgi:hypothetical protein